MSEISIDTTAAMNQVREKQKSDKLEGALKAKFEKERVEKLAHEAVPGPGIDAGDGKAGAAIMQKATNEKSTMRPDIPFKGFNSAKPK